MNVKLTLGIVLVLFLTLIGCESSTELDGKWDDNIKLSEKEVSVSSDATSVLITTDGTWWWLDGISWNGDWNYDLSESDVTEDNFLIEETEFTIERKNAKEIHITLTENTSESERVLIIGLQAGNYFDSLKVVQTGN